MNLAPLIMGIALSGLGIAGLVETILDIRRVRASASWLTAEGRVISSFVDELGAGQDDYAEKIRFEYEFFVDGNRRTGCRIRAGQEPDLTLGTGSAMAWSTARKDADKYPNGSRVIVHYDPRDPSRCCLETGGMTGILLKTMICIAIFIAGFILIFP